MRNSFTWGEYRCSYSLPSPGRPRSGLRFARSGHPFRPPISEGSAGE